MPLSQVAGWQDLWVARKPLAEWLLVDFLQEAPYLPLQEILCLRCWLQEGLLQDR